MEVEEEELVWWMWRRHARLIKGTVTEAASRHRTYTGACKERVLSSPNCARVPKYRGARTYMHTDTHDTH